MANERYNNAEIDCRGAGPVNKLLNPNNVLISKIYYPGEVKPSIIEVSCYYLTKERVCNVTGVYCPLLRVISNIT